MAGSAALAAPLKQADLAKLRDAATGDAEASRLAGYKGSTKLTGYLLLTAGQKEGKPSLYVLCSRGEYQAKKYVFGGGYEIEKPEELFGNAKASVPRKFTPDLEPVSDSLVQVFDSEGRVLSPFGGDNYTSHGYFFDFDKDGILDRADSTNYAVDEAPKDSIQVFKLQTVEPTPRVLLEVVFNWHPSSSPDSNDWTFTCQDEDKDGVVEIVFGPESVSNGSNGSRIVFRMDPVTRLYSAGEIPAKSHVRVVAPGESLASIARAGGLGYPLVGASPDEEDEENAPPSPQGSYVFRSFKDRSSGEIAAFFRGKSRGDSFFSPEGSFPNKIPGDLWDLDPRQAALALAEAHRTAEHRAEWTMVLDDRGGVAPPASGWLLHDWHSSGCYSFSSHLFALRFGVPEPELTVFGYNSIGAVGRNPWADHPAHNVRVIRLSEKEARFLADTVFWLDRIRTASKTREDSLGAESGNSTADGHATVTFYPDGKAPREMASETVWASPVSARWKEDYTKTLFANLTELLMGDALPAMLGERWRIAPDLGHHNLVTPTEERLKPRVDDEARRTFAAAFEAILRQHEKDPLPPPVIAELAGAAGQEALVQLAPALRKLLEALPELTDEDREFTALEKRFERDHFGNPLEEGAEEDKAARARLDELRGKREFLPSAILREPLADAVEKLRLAGSARELIKTVKANPPLSVWAMGQILRLDPAAWAGMLTEQFKAAELQERRMIFGTLAAGNPEAAAKLVDKMTAGEYSDLIIEIARYHQQQDDNSVTRDIPGLMKIVRNREDDIHRRAQAMALLAGAKLDEETLREFTGLLVAEIRNPQQGEYGMDTRGDAVKAITLLPDARDHLELITTVPGIVEDAYGAGMAAIVKMAGDPGQREDLLTGFIRLRFKKSPGMMNDVFLDTLAHDLRELAPEIAAFASEKPEVTDGDGADYSGGHFNGPAGQRYHMAREVTALWSEKDPVTLGRMWIFFVAAHPYQFRPDNTDKTLLDMAARRIGAVGKERLREEIDTALRLLPVSEHEASTEEWLRNLGKN